MNKFDENPLSRRPLRLTAKDYQALCRVVLERDGWRCQKCGVRKQLQVHHQQYRSQSGEDTESNLITLCALCHREVHEHTRRYWGP